MSHKQTNILNSIKNFFRRGDDGTAIIEFAIIAPVFFLMFMGLLEFALIFFTYSVLEGAAARASRVGLTGYAGPANNRMGYIRSEINRLSGGYLDPNRLSVTVLSYNSFASVGDPEPCLTALCQNGAPNVDYQDVNGNLQWDADQGKAGAGSGNEVVFYKLEYPWPLFTPLMANIIGNASGNFVVSSVATVKNEGF